MNCNNPFRFGTMAIIQAPIAPIHVPIIKLNFVQGHFNTFFTIKSKSRSIIKFITKMTST